MGDASHLLRGFKAKGYRFSRIRQSILNLLYKNAKPLSAYDLGRLLIRMNVPANKTTVYRELASLKEEKIIRELRFSDGKRRYEITPKDHHHHIVCESCKKIEDVVLDKDLYQEEKMITQIKNFKVLNHSLEFYGICGGCLKNG